MRIASRTVFPPSCVAEYTVVDVVRLVVMTSPKLTAEQVAERFITPDGKPTLMSCWFGLDLLPRLGEHRVELVKIARALGARRSPRRRKAS